MIIRRKIILLAVIVFLLATGIWLLYVTINGAIIGTIEYIFTLIGWLFGSLVFLATGIFLITVFVKVCKNTKKQTDEE